ncbi:hypothetical protein GMOD_00005595 [Pyrenophora seminiperda CCB06]|uniref:Uncharacterized protein n=1 Tax=Pyrenophora seminiperda CCB06 TaxID=1302712 RepID=A0A3M7M9B4_9PLEO|nr:hypothetical protein GMOD_00005595 [Pyrenophora seminiperda CCB06]
MVGKNLGTDHDTLAVPAKGRRRQSSAFKLPAKGPSTPRRNGLHHLQHTECAVEPINCTRTFCSHGRKQPRARRVHLTNHTSHERGFTQRKVGPLPLLYAHPIRSRPLIRCRLFSPPFQATCVACIRWSRFWRWPSVGRV